VVDYRLGLQQNVGLQLEQRLIITQEMQQALQILQMQTLDLAQWLQQELQQNPVLEDITITEEPPPTEETPATANEDMITPTTLEGKEKSMTIEEEKERTAIDWSRYDDGRDLGLYGHRPRDDEPDRPLENLVANSESLEGHLHNQLVMIQLDDQENRAAEAIISEIDENGYYSGDLGTLGRAFGLESAHLERLLKLIQSFDPDGIGARNLTECLQIQLSLQGEEHSWAYRIVSEHLDDVYHKRWQRISRCLGITTQKVQEAAEKIANLQPRPGSTYDTSDVRYIVPDVIVRKIDNQYEVIINDEHLPHLRLSSRYQQIFNNPQTKESTKEYLKRKFNDAEWIIRSIYQRNNTIYRVASTLVNLQFEFIEKGIAYLRPLTLQDVAQRIEMSESTVSRVTSNKYIQIPGGIMRMRLFFSGGLPSDDGVTSSRSVHESIRLMIENENRSKPLTDTEIQRQLQNDGVKIARRTVCKYREDLGLLPAKMRRQQ